MSDYEPRTNPIKKDWSVVTVNKEVGIKHDQSKPDLTLIPKIALDEMAKAFGYGAQKYGRRNYEKGMKVTRTLAAAMRHITAFVNKEDLDEESGNSHLAHALASLAMSLRLLELDKANDDR